MAALHITQGMKSKLLSSLASIATSIATPQIDKLALRLADALMALSEVSVDAKEASLSFNSANLLKKNIYVFHFLALGCLQKNIQNELGLLEPSPKSNHNKVEDELTLVPYADMDKKLLLSNMSRPLEAFHADQLSALRLRFAHLLGREELSNNQNPFRPEIFISAINDAWCEFNPDTEASGMVLPLLNQEIFLDLVPVYLALNKEMISSGILPELAEFYNIRKTTNGPESKRKNDRLNPAALHQLQQMFSPQSSLPEIPIIPEINATSFPGVPLIPDLPTMPNMQQQNAPAFAQQYGGQKTTTIPTGQLLGLLAKLPKNQFGHASTTEYAGLAPSSSMLSSIKTTVPQGALTRVDESTIDLLSKVFDVVFRDQNIPAEMKSLIGFLQVPVLKTALVDKEFFFKEEHPARRLIELLTKTSLGWDQSKGPNDPVYQAIKRNVNRVQEEFDDKASVFSDVVSELETLIEQEENKSSEALSAPIAQALQREKLGEATKAAKNEVALRIGTGEVVAFVETFLENKWTSVLTLAYSIKDEKPRAVESALKTMDDLIWSVKPKISMEERKELISKLPSMLSMLNKWLNLVKLDDAERLQFFAELAECHASIVRAPLEMSPQRRLEIAIEVAQKAAERRLEKEAAKAPEPEPVVDDFVLNVENLERGMWLEFNTENAAHKKVKLSWVSPLRTLYIFSSLDKSESFSLSTEDLTETLREGRARILLQGGLVGRAINEALGDGVANDEQMQQQSAA